MGYDVSFEIDTGGTEPFILENFNHTFNCSRMFCDALRIAGLHETDGIRALHKKSAEDVRQYLQSAIEDMQSRKDYYQRFNPENNWGSYETAIQFLKDLEKMAAKHPKSIIDVNS
jgi:hypothetical protein